MVDLEALEKSLTFRALDEGECEGLIAEVRALRVERDALFAQLAMTESKTERLRRIAEADALRARVAELTAGLDMMFTSQHKLLDERDKDRARVVELTRLGDQLHGNLMGTLLHQPGCDCVCHRDLEAWRAVRG